MKRRIISIITALALCLSLCPTWAFAVEGEPDTGLCDHHREHIGCGYAAPTEGQPCGHEHTEDCYTADEAGGEVLDCQHTHDEECGYVQADPGQSCGYVCPLCPIEDLIAALPEQVTEDNADDVRGQLDHILDLYRELDEDEQGQLDLSRVIDLQGALDNANAPMMVVGEINIDSSRENTLTEEAGGCPGHTFTGTTASLARIYVESGAHDVTFSDLKIIAAANVGVAPGATMNLTITGTNTIKAGGYAGIYVPENATLVITAESTGTLEVSSSVDAGIGGAFQAPDDSDGDPNCGTVVINGGTITVIGGSMAAGIGGGSTNDVPGNGGNVTINGGTVTATGGSDQGYYGGAGIGGAGGLYDPIFGGILSGCGGSLTINGGHVTLVPGQYDSQEDTAYGFGAGSGDVSGGTCELTLADASYLDSSTTLDPNGKYTINGDPTADMIVVPEDLIYNGKAQELDGRIYIDESKTGSAEYFGRMFTVNASADGWVLQDLGAVVEAGEYTAVFKKGDKEISKTFTVAKSGTDLTEGKVQTYNGDTPTKDFTASDTITVKATPTATGQAPTKAAARLRGDPTAGQMAVFVNDTQVSAPADVGEDGAYTMTVSAADVLTLGGVEPNQAITLTAKFVGNDNMADAAGTVPVNISAVAKVEKGSSTTYVGALADAFKTENDGATITLLKDVTRATTLAIKVNCTLDLNGHNIKSTNETCLSVYGSFAVTIQGEGEIISEQSHALVCIGTVTLEGGTFTGNGENFAGVYANTSSILSVTGENVTIQNTGGGYGLAVNDSTSVQLSAGKYSGAAGAISIVSGSLTLGNLLGHSSDTRYAYFDESGTTPFMGVLGNKSLSGTVTVKKCEHDKSVCAYTPNDDADTHAMTCRACGLAGAAADCTYSDDYGHDETNHWQTCTLCGGKKTETHSWGYWWASTTSTIRRSCDKCEIGTAVGTVSVTPDFSVAYGETGSATLACTAELAEGYCLEPEDGEANCWYLTALSGSQSWSLGRDLQVQLPDDLPAGEYRYSASPRLSYQGDIIVGSNISIFGNVTVTPALLTVTGAAAKDRTYDGTNSVQITGVTLDGVLNSDNVSVDLTGLTGTLSGSDAGTYTGVTLPRLTLTGGAASNYTLPQSMGAVPASVTISKAPLTVTGVTIKTRPYKPTYHTAEVSGVSFTGLVNGDTLALGQDYTAFGNYDDPNAGENKSATILVELKSSAKANNYNLTNSSVSATGDVTKADSSISKAPAASEITYGQALSDSALTDGAGSVAGSFSWTAPATKPSAGTAQFEVTFTPTDTNYNTATVNVSVTVAKATPTITWSNPTQTLNYTGRAAEITPPTVTLVNGESFSGTFSYSYIASGSTEYTSGLPVNVGTYTVKASIAEQGNYTTAESGIMTLTISKVNYTGEKAGSTSGKFGREKTYDLSDLLPEGYKLGTPTKMDTNNIFDGDPTVNGTVLTYKLADNAEVGKTGKIAVTVTESTNYNPFDLTITVTVTDKIVPTLTVNPITVAYTGSAVSASAIQGTATAEGKTIPGSWKFADGQALTNVADSGTKTVIFTPTGEAEADYASATGTVRVTITKATPNLTLTPSPTTLPNGGTVTLTLSGLPAGGSATVTCSEASITVTKGSGDTWTAELPAGGASYTFTASYAGDGNHNGATANCTFSVDKIRPTLTLTASPASPLIGGGTVTLTLSGLPSGGTATVTCSGGITVTAGAGNTWTAILPNSTATYTFTASYTGSATHHAASASCIVETKEVVILPDQPTGDNGEQLRLVMETGISEVPAGLQGIVNTPKELETAMRTEITQATPGIPEANTAVYDVTLMVSTDGGATWTKATKDNFPTGGLTVTLPYPSGTNSSYHFAVVHMFTTSDFPGKNPGDTEVFTPDKVKNTTQGLQVVVTGLSPISVGWTAPATTPDTPSGGNHGGGGGGGSVSTYAVTVEKSEHGKVTSNRTNASNGSTVTLTVAPDSGYVLDTLTVTDSRGNEIRLTAQSGGKYTFTMPGRAVTVKATFAPLPDDTQKPCDGGADCPSRSFTDLGGVGTWYHEAVDYVLRHGLMNGYSNGTFGPNNNLSRAQLAQILYNKEGKPAVTGGSAFTDVAPGAWYAPAITWAAERGIVGGYGNGTFGPNDNITREQLAVMLWRYAGSPAATDKELHFTDADRASGYALEALRWAVENGIISGYGNGQLGPKGLATRVQVAQMLKNFLDK